MHRNELLAYALTSDEETPGWAWLMQNTEVQMDNQQQPNWTVRCFSDKTKTKHFIQKTGKAGAVAYANGLLAAGEKCKIYEYRPPKSRIDFIAERGRDG